MDSATKDSVESPPNRKPYGTLILTFLRSVYSRDGLEKDKGPFGVWEIVVEKNCPAQLNPNDCGIFSCLAAQYITEERKMDYNQSDADNLRLAMADKLAQFEEFAM